MAPSAEDAVDLYAAHAGEVALVLTDLVMPGMGGIGLLRALRERAVAGADRDDVGLRRRGRQRDGRRASGVGARSPCRRGGSGQIIQEALAGPSDPRPRAWPVGYDGAAMKRYRFAAFWATVLIVLGMLLVGRRPAVRRRRGRARHAVGQPDRPGRARARAGRGGPGDLRPARRRAVHRAGRDDAAVHRAAPRSSAPASTAAPHRAAPDAAGPARPPGPPPPTACSARRP